MMVAKRRITATRAILEPRRFLMREYHAFIARSLRSTCRMTWPSTNRTIRLPCFVIDPKRDVASPELRHPGVSPQYVGQAARPAKLLDRPNPGRHDQAAVEVHAPALCKGL